MISRLEKLYLEKKVVSNLSLLPPQVKSIMENYYDREIKGINDYGFENPQEGEDSLVAMKRAIKIKKAKEK